MTRGANSPISTLGDYISHWRRLPICLASPTTAVFSAPASAGLIYRPGSTAASYIRVGSAPTISDVGRQAKCDGTPRRTREAVKFGRSNPGAQARELVLTSI